MSRLHDVLTLLRTQIPQGERGLVGYEEIAAYLAQVGWVTREGHPPSPHTIRFWKRTRGFPVALLPGKPRRVWTTSYTVTA